MKTRAAALIVFLLSLAFIGLRTTQTQAFQATNPQPTPPEKELQSITLVFGSKDTKPTDWDGSVAISKGEIVRLLGYHFTADHSVSNNSWKCGTYEWGSFNAGMHPNEKGQPQPTPMQPCGVTILFRAPGDARFTVKVPTGEFTFRPMDVPEGEGIFPLGATIEVTRSATAELATTAAYQDDFPSIAADGDRMWLSWVAYKDKADRVFLRSQLNGVWTEPIEINEKPADIFMTAVAVSAGKPVVVWSEKEPKGFQLKARTPSGPVMKVTDTTGNHLFHRLTSDVKGNIHLVWQSFRQQRSDIYMKSFINGAWSAEINLSDSKRDLRANDWNPTVAADRDGVVWVAWDSYATGSYNIFLRSVRNGQPGPIQQVTNTSRFHAHPNLAVDAQNRVWLAWDESRENWGKDTGFLLSGGTGLYDSRKIVIAVLDKGKWLAPLQQIEDIMPYGFRRFTQTARMISDSKGRMWMFLRPRSNTKLPTTLWAAGGKWENRTTNIPDDHCTGIQAHANKELNIILFGKLLTDLRHPLLHAQGRLASVGAVVAVIERRIPKSHHRITNKFIQRPTGSKDNIRHVGEIAVEHGNEFLGRQLF